MSLQKVHLLLVCEQSQPAIANHVRYRPMTGQDQEGGHRHQFSCGDLAALRPGPTLAEQVIINTFLTLSFSL
jgi:hypothetical protein